MGIRLKPSPRTDPPAGMPTSAAVSRPDKTPTQVPSRTMSTACAGVPRQGQRPDELPAARAVLAADSRVAATLRLPLADGRCGDHGAALDNPLVDVGSFARDQPLGGVPDLAVRLSDVRAVLEHRAG